MNALFNVLLSAGPMVLLAALVAVPVYYMIYRHAPTPQRPSSLAQYLLACLGVGALAYGTGTMIGIFVICSFREAGNLCGLAGVFGVGPLLSGVAVWVYAHLWTRRMRMSPRLSSGDAADTRHDC